MSGRVLCVASYDVRPVEDPNGIGVVRWCALAVGAELDEEALHDRTACGNVVTLRVGSIRRVPTCRECRAVLLKVQP